MCERDREAGRHIAVNGAHRSPVSPASARKSAQKAAFSGIKQALVATGQVPIGSRL